MSSLACLGLVLCTGAPGALADEKDVDGAQQVTEQRHVVEGRVLDAGAPVPKVLVYAFEVASNRLEKVQTDERGLFFFESLPAGMYKLVAFKPGFVPTVELLLRRTERDRQFVEMRLQDERLGDTREREDYWTVRGRVPADVLRQIQSVELAGGTRDWSGPMEWAPTDFAGFQFQNTEFFEAQMRALSGVESIAGGQAQFTNAEVGLRGAVGDLSLGVDGSIQQLQSVGGEMIDGEVTSLAFQLAAAEQHQVRVASSTGQLAGPTSVDLERYQIDWSGKAGQQGETRVSASFQAENNYFLSGGLDPAIVPDGSQTWDVSGSYHGDLGDRTSLQAGLTYRQRSIEGIARTPVDERVGMFGVVGSQIAPKVLVEYGLYSSVRDGSLSLMPHGGVVVDLGDTWKAKSSFAQRVEDTTSYDDPIHRFGSAFFTDAGTCRQAGEACYEIFFSHGRDDEEVTIGAVHRRYAETLRLYFSPDFFDRLESLFVVEGDELPELQFSMVRRVTPQILAKLESNIASGGGGIFYATDSAAYENEVRYLVTSLDTQFQQTSTGVFVAFHHLEQALSPVAAREQDGSSRVEVQRLQLMLTQDLSALIDLASRWAVRLNMEVSRGATPYTLTADDELYKKLTGGFSVSF